MKKIWRLMLTLAVVGLLATGCAKNNDAPKLEEDTKNNKVICGILEMNTLEEDALHSYSQKSDRKSDELPFGVKTYSSLKSILLDLKNDRITYSIMPLEVAKYIGAKVEEYSVKEQVGGNSRFHMATRKEDTELCENLSKAILDLQREGTMDKLVERYVKNYDKMEKTKIADTKENNYVVGITGDFPPFDYVDEKGQPSGFNVALMNAIGEKLGCTFTFVQLDANARLSALASKKIDIVFLNNILVFEGFETKNDLVNLTAGYYTSNSSIVFSEENEEIIKKALSKTPKKAE